MEIEEWKGKLHKKEETKVGCVKRGLSPPTNLFASASAAAASASAYAISLKPTFLLIPNPTIII